ncbi:MAG: primosomal protein N' [Clostridiales bacterium GWB2_37_7]|nr:MAG: primosomal protein N' [Clostridiales bacterium GWB2_37_7]
MPQRYAEVIINNKSKATDKLFHYAVPDSLIDNIQPGCRVIVPFGVSNKHMEAYVMGLTDHVDIPIKRIKQISSLIDDYPLIPSRMLKLVEWMKEKYICFYIDAIQAVIPTPIRTKSTSIIELIEENYEEKKLKLVKSEIMLDILEYIEANDGTASIAELKSYFSELKLEYFLKKLSDINLIVKKQVIKSKLGKKIDKLLYVNMNINAELSKNAAKQKELLDYIRNNPGVTAMKLKSVYKGCDSSIKTLINKDYINVIEKEEYRYGEQRIYEDKQFVHTSLQIQAIEQIENNFAKKKNVLLHGVTGSGKTEVYLDLIEKHIAMDKDCIILVPEISLTPQMITRFKGRLGDKVAVLHSGLNEGEKYDEWRKIKTGEVKAVVGARSAIFAPFANLGIIIIDEEHETTYKSDIKPKYITREVAEKRCQLEGACLIMGSATPSIESYFRAQSGELGLVELPDRINGREMPEVFVVDMREELKQGNKTIFSQLLTEEILTTLKESNQLILFLNRRGHSTFVSCRECGLVMKCPRCNISLTYHINEDSLSCHYCGATKLNPKLCPKCGSKYIKYFGVGTQKLEKEFQKKFSIKNTLRMDADTTRFKNSHQAILDIFRSGKSKVLLGTQMISKGLDFPDVTLVGVITADTSINLPDFRSAEKTFQMIAQVAGRSGRGSKEGKVIVQTYTPEHYSIKFAQVHDYIGFYKEEIKLRRELAYPPFSHLANIIISGFDERRVIKEANEIGVYLDLEIKRYKAVEKLGPSTAPLSKIKSKYRWQIILKGSSEIELRELLERLALSKFTDIEGISLSIDMNPNNML